MSKRTYRNAGDILPDPLLKELQRYAQGELLYVPQMGERKSWGEGSGARRYYAQRNAELHEKYRQGAAIEALAEEYGLSYERVKKILAAAL